MKFLKGCLVIFILVVGSPSYGYLAKGGGANSCTYLLDNFDPQMRVLWRQWVTGFISGLNYAYDDTETGREIDESSFVYEVKNYCEVNPMKSVAHAVEDLYFNKLKKK